MRRSLLLAPLLAAPLAPALVASPATGLLGCSGSTRGAASADGGGVEAAPADDGGVSTPPAWDQPVTRPDDGTATAARAACQFKRGDMPAATLGPSTPVDSAMPIQNIVVVMMENHSFDSYLGHLNAYANRSDVETAPAGASNPGVDGGAVPWQHAAHLCSLDTNHEWAGTHQEIDHGAMDGFVRVNDGTGGGGGTGDSGASGGGDAAGDGDAASDGTATGDAGPTGDGAPAGDSGPASDGGSSLASGSRAMWWYDQTDLPFYYQLASTFAIADHYHASVPGPTWPNRMYLFAATSFGETTNVFPDLTAFPWPTNDASLLDELEKRHTSWHLYSDGVPGAAVVYALSLGSRWGHPVLSSFAQFQADAANGMLPEVSFVDPNLSSEMNGGAGTDEHPPGDIQSGQLFISQVVQAVTTSPQWQKLALFITHDEHGGFYDHVPPPPACAPDTISPKLGAGDTTQGGFDLYGVRVLLLAVSPYAKKGYVSHAVYDHTSIARFIEAKFKIPALTARDANATPPTDLFDFTSPPTFATPPALTAPVIDPAELQYCTATFGQ
jgi:phospholipase C